MYPTSQYRAIYTTLSSMSLRTVCDHVRALTIPVAVLQKAVTRVQCECGSTDECEMCLHCGFVVCERHNFMDTMQQHTRKHPVVVELEGGFFTCRDCGPCAMSPQLEGMYHVLAAQKWLTSRNICTQFSETAAPAAASAPSCAPSQRMRTPSRPTSTPHDLRAMWLRSNTEESLVPVEVFPREVSSSSSLEFVEVRDKVVVTRCCICLDECEAYVPSDSCRHSESRFCRDCLEGYVTSQLQDRDGRLAANGVLACPFPRCKAELCPADLRDVLDADLRGELATALTLAALRKNSEFAECCFCHTQALVDSAQMNCPNCRRSSCTHHSVAWHTGLTCAEYDTRQNGDVASRDLIEAETRRCPSCTAPIQKSYGCDHMTCRCGFEFCFVCLADYRAIINGSNLQHNRGCKYRA